MEPDRDSFLSIKKLWSGLSTLSISYILYEYSFYFGILKFPVNA